ncbi:MAG: rod shape-determining protein RodA [Legionellales bacterium]|nr:rod shape-determining protein RodA [Legionellales bacterium]|tara:strand:- start:47287 stop:48438 length:1152 start_codon:yes stop_codon:yes gene_type:complete
MSPIEPLKHFSHQLNSPEKKFASHNIWQRLHIDLPLLAGIVLLTGLGLVILYSAGNQSPGMMARQLARLGLAFMAMFIVAQIPPAKLRLWAPWLYGVGLSLLIAVLVIGTIGKGARRWLDLGLFRFQPSEIMKLAIPLFLAWYYQDKPLPPSKKCLLIGCIALLVPVLLTAKQPDLGTALMLVTAGVCVLFLAGMQWWIIIGLGALATLFAPILWHFMHDYQRQRVLTFLYPERDPLGTGYHIIQSKIAIGSGGLFGKGWLEGTQAHLHFLPEHATDFIFGVTGEEFGLFGGLVLLAVYLFIVGRGLYISSQAQDTFTRLLAGSLSLMFFFSIFINIGMVTGILPVVGLPLPLVSYGGTSMVTLLAGFGILMSVNTHRKLLAR